jgi:glycosyltransferase involved in cell wall biosynthesis
MRIILAVTNDLTNDQRLHRICTTLVEDRHNVTLVGRVKDIKDKSSKPLIRNYKTYRFSLFINKGKLFYFLYNLYLFFYLVRKKFDIVTANDLDTVPACVLAAILKRKKCYYDAHEWFTEVPELENRPITKYIWLVIEKLFYPFINNVYTVNDKLADIYRNKCKKDVFVIRNVPFYNTRNIIKKEIGNPLILLYQGSVNIGRGLDLVLQAMAHLPNNVILWIVGNGDEFQNIYDLATELKLHNRVKFWGSVPFEELKEITSKASIGLSLEADLGLNYRYATPNKIYDYIQHSLPVIVSPLPLMKAIVEEWNIGIVLPERTINALVSSIKYLQNNPNAYNQMSKNAFNAAKFLNWENEKSKLSVLYQAH